jgi:hypothetical protein
MVAYGWPGALSRRPTPFLLISASRAGSPRPLDGRRCKDGAAQAPPRTALLIIGSKPDPRRVQTGSPDHHSLGRRGHVHSSRSSSPPARGCPTCRVREPARAASRGIPLRESFRALGPQRTGPSPTKQTHASASMDVSLDHAAYPYRTGHGRPLEPPTNSSTRNPQFATRPMGVAETSPSVLRRDGEGALKDKS